MTGISFQPEVNQPQTTHQKGEKKRIVSYWVASFFCCLLFLIHLLIMNLLGPSYKYWQSPSTR